MSKIIILCGISGSGKSRFAATCVQNNTTNYVVVSRDKLRELTYGFTDFNVSEYYNRTDLNYLENQITYLQDNLINYWLEKDKSIIVDNTHLKQKYINYYNKFNVNIEIKYFDIDLNVAIERNFNRTRKVSKEIIEKQYEQYLKIKKDERICIL